MKRAIGKIPLEEGYIKSFELVEQNGSGRHPHHAQVYRRQGECHLLASAASASPAFAFTCVPKSCPVSSRDSAWPSFRPPVCVMTDKKARELNVGGEVLAFVW